MRPPTTKVLDALERTAVLVREHGAYARPVRAVIAALTERPWALAELVPALGVERRTVEEVLAALGEDLVDGRIAPERVAAYRARFGYDQLRATEPADPLGPALAARAGLITLMASLREAAPRPRRELDHVAATAETAVRRALWLDAHYDLDGAHLLCVGDHDLTALAACLVRPSLAATVVDLDERLLEYISSAAADHDLRVRCFFADLRFRLPGVVGAADLAFTDPPYTPEGVELFVGRAFQGLPKAEGRVLLAYGFSDRKPALGAAVQRVFDRMDLVTEAMLPDFSRYHGAQAIGGASDLYVLRRARRPQGGGKPRRSGATIYTHGGQSSEGWASALTPEAAELAGSVAAGPAGLPVLRVGVGPGVDRPLGAVWTGGIPGPARAGGVVVDATADPTGGWLLRILLAVNAERLAVVVPNDHPDLANAAAQQALTDLVGVKWDLRFRRSAPGPRGALVEAVRKDAVGVPDVIVAHLLDRAHGVATNVWSRALRELLRLSAGEASARISDTLRRFLGTDHDPVTLDVDPDAYPVPLQREAPWVFRHVEAGATLMDLPRHRMAPLLAAVRGSTSG